MVRPRRPAASAAADGELAVIGVLMDAGAENTALRELRNFMPRQAGPARVERPRHG